MDPGLLEAIKSRRSVRFFKPDPVPREVVERILEAAIHAPNAGNAQQWFFIVVESEEKRREIHRLLKQAHRIYATWALREHMPPEKVEKWMRLIDEGMYWAPIYVAAYIDMRSPRLIPELRELEELMAVQSLAAAIENMILAAHAMGLGAVWLGVPLLIEKRFNEVLQPPPGCRLQAVIALGYPAEEPKPRPRKPLSEVVKFV